MKASAALVLLIAVPVAAGVVRLTQLASGAAVTPENARFFASPVPVVVHIIGASLFCVLGAFQFAPKFRRKHPKWHRVTGRVLVPCGLAAGLSGLWMTLFYPRPPGDGDLLAVFRVLAGSAMVASLVLGFVLVRRRDFAGHRAWMMRGYALGQGAGTQVLTILPWTLLAGTPSVFIRALLMGAAWLINLAVAEWLIRRRPRRRRVAVPPVLTPAGAAV
jgi:uncharacterized membrane protein